MNTEAQLLFESGSIRLGCNQIAKPTLSDKVRRLPSPTGNFSGESSERINPIDFSQSLEPEMHTVRVMVVDDEPDMVKVLKIGLQRKGFDVDGYTDPVQALEHFKPHQYEVVLLDIRMPKLDGMELYRQMRAVDGDVIICFVSAYEQYKRQFEITYPQEQSGCFIQKPFRIDNLVSIIHSRVERK